ncbi:hypothetical protein CBM2634_U170002 [Cupriavidus taiwanensis]|uniref:Uncharacterized protein n=1 Tax=Cupriavidus taiwanensis TaxID=164546 RepID=A0A375JDB9_9BURK|nr:hypothetical protein CBM2634_U170002 [Cupriavidus taiwanensis]
MFLGGRINGKGQQYEAVTVFVSCSIFLLFEKKYGRNMPHAALDECCRGLATPKLGVQRLVSLHCWTAVRPCSTLLKYSDRTQNTTAVRAPPLNPILSYSVGARSTYSTIAIRAGEGYRTGVVAHEAGVLQASIISVL